MKPQTIGKVLRVTVLAALCPLVIAQAPKPLPPPDLHAGGASPSLIPNHEVTEVKLPGYNLAGITLTVSGVCTLESYEVIGNAIHMKLKGNRTITDPDGYCNLNLARGKQHAATWLIVGLTDEEQAQQDSNQRDANRAKAATYISGLGSQWTLHYSDGSSEVFRAQPAGNPGELPEFTSSSGTITKILVSKDNKVMIMADSCLLYGTLSGSQVKDGTFRGDCKHSGVWTGEKK